MDGFYRRAEAANILGCTVNSISQFMKQGRLRSITKNNTVYIPQEDVIYLYENRDSSPIVMRHEVDSLKKQLESLRSEVEVLKMGVGIRARRGEWTDDRIRLFYSKSLMSLGRASWETKRIYEYADELLSLSEKEMSRLLVIQGHSAWIGLYDLASRMMTFIKNNELFPSNGLETLYLRVEGGRNKLCGIIHVAINHSSMIKYQASRKLKKKVEKKPIDEFLEAYLKERNKK